MLAPIIIFAYNRPEHLRRTLVALSENELADQSILYIYCDGPKVGASEMVRGRIVETRKVAHECVGFKETIVIEADENKGLANSIIGGVTDVIGRYGKVIVLEDDLLTSPYFLKYMNGALDYYEHRPSVMSISANRPTRKKMGIPSDYPYDVFVCLRSYSTGWATWSDRWNRVDWSLDYLEDFMRHPEQVEAFNRGGDDLTELLKLQKNGGIDSWAIRFSFAHFREHAVAILPCIPYVDNIGFDGSGIHSGKEEKNFRNDVSQAVESPRFPDLLYEDKRIVNAFYNYYCRRRRPVWQKICNHVCRWMKMPPPFVIKKKVYD